MRQRDHEDDSDDHGEPTKCASAASCPRISSTFCGHGATYRKHDLRRERTPACLTMWDLGIQSTHDCENSLGGYIGDDSPACWCGVGVLGSRLGDAADAASERHRVRHPHA